MLRNALYSIFTFSNDLYYYLYKTRYKLILGVLESMKVNAIA